MLARILNGRDNLANNGSLAISFFHDGFGGTATNGDASMASGASDAGTASNNFYTMQLVPVDAAAVI